MEFEYYLTRLQANNNIRKIRMRMLPSVCPQYACATWVVRVIAVYPNIFLNKHLDGFVCQSTELVLKGLLMSDIT